MPGFVASPTYPRLTRVIGDDLACTVGCGCRAAATPDRRYTVDTVHEGSRAPSRAARTGSSRSRDASPAPARDSASFFTRAAAAGGSSPWRTSPSPRFSPTRTWRNSTHLGTEYAALLVEADYRPPARADVLPSPGGPVIAVATAKGEGSVDRPPAKADFSGYEWQIRQVPSDRGGANEYDPANAWTDERGALHLRIAGSQGRGRRPRSS